MTRKRRTLQSDAEPSAISTLTHLQYPPAARPWVPGPEPQHPPARVACVDTYTSSYTQNHKQSHPASAPCFINWHAHALRRASTAAPCLGSMHGMGVCVYVGVWVDGHFTMRCAGRRSLGAAFAKQCRRRSHPHWDTTQAGDIAPVPFLLQALHTPRYVPTACLSSSCCLLINRRAPKQQGVAWKALLLQQPTPYKQHHRVARDCKKWVEAWTQRGAGQPAAQHSAALCAISTAGRQRTTPLAHINVT